MSCSVRDTTNGQNVFACSSAGCSFATKTEKGLHIHQRKVHYIETPNSRARNRRGRGTAAYIDYPYPALFDKPYSCAICGFRTGVRSDILNHSLEEHEFVKTQPLITNAPQPKVGPAGMETAEVLSREGSKKNAEKRNVDYMQGYRSPIQMMSSPLYQPAFHVGLPAYTTFPGVHPYLPYGLPHVYPRFFTQPSPQYVSVFPAPKQGDKGVQSQTKDKSHPGGLSDPATDNRAPVSMKTSPNTGHHQEVQQQAPATTEPKTPSKSPSPESSVRPSSVTKADGEAALSERESTPIATRKTLEKIVEVVEVEEEDNRLANKEDTKPSLLRLREICPELFSERQDQPVEGFIVAASPSRDQFLEALGGCRASRSPDGVLSSFCCSICSQQFDDIRAIRQHLRMHIAYAPFRCNNCGLQCLEREEATVHLRFCKRREIIMID